MLKFSALAISFMLISPPIVNGILPEIRDSLGITQPQSELIATMPSIAVLITILLSSFFLKFFSIKTTVLAGLILTGIGGILPVFTGNFTLILIGRAILGIGLGLYGPLAIELINILFAEDERPRLMGYRSAIEQIGRSLMTLLAGGLLLFGWNMSFVVYSFAFVLAFIFYKHVPQIERESPDLKQNQAKAKPSLLVYLIGLLAAIVVLNGAAIDVRFPALIAEITGEAYNSSNIIAVKPFFGMLAGFVFGKLYQQLGKRLLYFSLALLVVAGLLVALSANSITLLIVGFYLAGVVPAWIFPFIFTTIAKITTGKNREFAMSLVLIALHASVFLMTPVVRAIEVLTGNDSLRSPYPVLSGLLLFSLIFMIFLTPKIVKKQ